MLKQALGSTLLITASHCFALTLGATQGNVIMGRPMDVLVSSSIEAADAAAGLCLEAEVLYGETRVPASAVTTAIHRIGPDGNGALRVRASTPINEPIVTLMLKVGCQNSFRRSYTLLADFEPAPTPAALVVSRDVTAPNSAGRVTEPSRRNLATSAPSAPSPAASVEAAAALQAETPVRLAAPLPRPVGVVHLPSKSRPAPRVTSGNVADASTPRAAAQPAGARLKLDPLELSAVTGSTGLAGSGNTPTPATANPETALPSSQTPEDAAHPAPPTAAAATETLQKEMQSLREEQQRLRLAMESVNTQLTEAKGDRYNNPLVYGLSALVLVLLGGLWYVRRSRSAQTDSESTGSPWWKGGGVTAASQADLPQPEFEPSGSDEGFAVSSDLHLQRDMDDLSGLEAVEAGATQFQEVPVTKVDVSTLLELWQQVDFLVSIGQPFDALQLLETFVLDHPRASEAPYLRWLQLALQQGNERALAQAQAAYEHHFHRLLPAGASSVTNRSGLEGDTVFLQRLAQVWPKEEAHSLVATALFSQPGDPGNVIRERGLLVFDDLITLSRLLRTLPDVPEFVAPEPAAEAMATAAPLANEDMVAQWLSMENVPAVPGTTQKAPEPESSARAELPPLDFDFLDFGAAPSQGTAAAPDGANKGGGA